MIFHAVDPRSPEWEKLRLGNIGSSEFSSIVTPKRLDLSESRYKLMDRCLAEWITGMPVENATTEWMDRGTELEDKAIIAYEVMADMETSLGGWITLDDGIIGCSPDRLVGDDGDLEIKSPLIQTQIGYALRGIEDSYRMQIQGRMWITGRKWVDLFSYHPAFALAPIRVLRDRDYINKIEKPILMFRDELLEARLKLERLYGPFTRPEPPAEADHSGDFVTAADVEAILAANAERDARV